MKACGANPKNLIQLGMFTPLHLFHLLVLFLADLATVCTTLEKKNK